MAIVVLELFKFKVELCWFKFFWFEEDENLLELLEFLFFSWGKGVDGDNDVDDGDLFFIEKFKFKLKCFIFLCLGKLD